MRTLREVLTLSGYTSHEAQVSYCKLLAYRQCFNSPALLNATHPLQIEHKEEAQQVFLKTTLKAEYPEHQDRLISDDEAQALLTTHFPSLEDGFKWLFHITRLKFLRATYDEEGVGKENERTAVNSSQWTFQDEIKIEGTGSEDLEQKNRKFYKLFDALKLIESFPPIPDEEIKHVVVMSSMEQNIKERVQFMAESMNFDGTLYFLSGARGLFNSEPSLAPILAEWFGEPQKEALIQAVLDQHQAFDDPCQWTQNLSALKAKILTALELTEWCDAKEKSWYYHEPDIYEEMSTLGGRESLRDWPVAMDMFVYLVKQKQKLHPEWLKNVDFVSVVAPGRNNKLPVSEDFILAWYKKHGKKIFDANDIPLFIICNGTHRLSYLTGNLEHHHLYQGELVKKAIKVNLKSFIDFAPTEEESITSQNHFIFVAGPKAKKFSVHRGLDVLARSLWTMNENIEKLIARYELIEKDKIQLQEDSGEPEDTKVYYIEEMNYYHSQKEYLYFINSLINLAITYFKEKNYIKTSGLFNCVLGMQEKVPAVSELSIASLLEQTIIINTLEFIKNKTPVNSGKIFYIKAFLTLHYHNNKKILKNIRKLVYQQFKETQADSKEEILALYKSYLNKLNVFISHLIQQSKILLNKNLPLFFGYLGSSASKQPTPYSDLEFYILISNESDFSAALVITKMLLLLVLAMHETMLRSMWISVSDRHGKIHDLLNRDFDRFTKRGISFDFNDPAGACITPLGAKIGERVLYRLIDTPPKFAVFAAKKSVELKLYLPQMLRLSSPMTGERELFRRFQYFLHHETQQPSFAVYCIDLLRREIETGLANLYDAINMQHITHKNYFYRPLMCLIDDLYLTLAPTKNSDAFKKLDRLLESQIINPEQKLILEQMVCLVLYLRMKEHFRWGENKYSFTDSDPETIALKKCLHQLIDIYKYFKDKLKSVDETFIHQIHQVSAQRMKSQCLLFSQARSPEGATILNRKIKSRL